MDAVAARSAHGRHRISPNHSKRDEELRDAIAAPHKYRDHSGIYVESLSRSFAEVAPGGKYDVKRCVILLSSEVACGANERATSERAAAEPAPA